MANYIKVAVINSVITLYERGWSKRRIARELALDRETVRRHLRRWQLGISKPAISTAPIAIWAGKAGASLSAGLQKGFQIDITRCPRCRTGTMKIVAELSKTIPRCHDPPGRRAA